MNAINKINSNLFRNEQLQMIDEITERVDGMIHDFDANYYSFIQLAMTTILRVIKDMNAKELETSKGQVTSDVKNVI